MARIGAASAGNSCHAARIPANAARRLRVTVGSPGFAFVGILAAWQLFPALAAPILATLVRVLYPAQ